MFFSNTNIPQELLSNNSSEGDVSILIGENGSGKSQMLGQLTSEYLRQGKKVIAISNSIYDKFPDSGRNLHLLRDRAGRKKAKRSIKTALLNISPEDITRLKNASEALRFIGYDPVIGLERISVTVDMLDNALSRDEFRDYLNPNEIDDLKSLLFKSGTYNSEPIVWLTLNDFSFREIDRASLIQLLKWEGVLKKLQIINSFNIFLRKNGQEIPLLEASSGELSFISTIVYLSTTIDENSVILIDEPENSLHPSWQKDYIKILVELFYLYQPRVIAATHSALIVTGAEVSNPTTKVFECRNFQFIKRGKEPVNIEEAFIDYFNVVTPQNRYLSDLVIDMLNKLASGETNIDEIGVQIDRLKNESFEGEQLKMLDGVKEIAQKIIDRQNSNESPNSTNPVN